VKHPLCWHATAVRSSVTALWGLTAAADGPLDVTVVGADSGRKRAGIRCHRAGQLLPRDTAIKEGLPVSSPARTLLDLSTCCRTRVVEKALDQALVVLEVVRPNEFEEVAKRARFRGGTGLFRELLAARSGGTLTQSQAEEGFLQLIRWAGLPMPETQAPLDRFRIDFLWRDLGVRPDLHERRCDIGAYERQDSSTAVPPATI
jgi:hypothetical protein